MPPPWTVAWLFVKEDCTPCTSITCAPLVAAMAPPRVPLFDSNVLLVSMTTALPPSPVTNKAPPDEVDSHKRTIERTR